MKNSLESNRSKAFSVLSRVCFSTGFIVLLCFGIIKLEHQYATRHCFTGEVTYGGVELNNCNIAMAERAIRKSVENRYFELPTQKCRIKDFAEVIVTVPTKELTKSKKDDAYIPKVKIQYKIHQPSLCALLNRGDWMKDAECTECANLRYLVEEDGLVEEVEKNLEDHYEVNWDSYKMDETAWLETLTENGE